MKTVREPAKEVKSSKESTLSWATLSELNEDDLAEIRLICMRAMTRGACQDRRADTPTGRPAFRVIDGGMQA